MNLETQITLDIYRFILVEINGYTQKEVNEMVGFASFECEELWEKIHAIVKSGIEKVAVK